MSKKYLGTAQRVVLWKLLEANGVGTATNLTELLDIIRPQVNFEITDANLRHIMKELGLQFSKPQSETEDIKVLADALREIYAQLGVPVPHGLFNILSRK